MRLRALLAAALLVGAMAGCGSSPDPVSPPTVSALRDAETKIAALLEDVRVEAGLPTLIREPALDAVARSWAVRLAGSGELEHNPAYAAEIPDGWSASGENVGWADPAVERLEDLPAALHEAWLDSPTHKANLLDPAYTAVGIGIAYDEANGYYVTQDFAAYPD